MSYFQALDGLRGLEVELKTWKLPRCAFVLSIFVLSRKRRMVSPVLHWEGSMSISIQLLRDFDKEAIA